MSIVFIAEKSKSEGSGEISIRDPGANRASGGGTGAVSPVDASDRLSRPRSGRIVVR
jgi:hypothetical protein